MRWLYLPCSSLLDRGYRMLRYGAEYVKQSMAEYEAKLRASLERHLRAKAARLGFELVPRGGPLSAG